MQLFKSVAGGAHAIFARNLLRNELCLFGKAGIAHHRFQRLGHALRRIILLLNHPRHFQSLHAPRVIGLVVRVGHDQHRLARAQALCRCPHAALVHHQAPLAKKAPNKAHIPQCKSSLATAVLGRFRGSEPISSTALTPISIAARAECS